MIKEKYNFRLLKIDNRKINDYRDVYEELCGAPIDVLVDDLSMQVKIEQLAIKNYLLGFKRGRAIYSKELAQLRHQRKVYLERIKGLEAMLKEKSNENKN